MIKKNKGHREGDNEEEEKNDKDDMRAVRSRKWCVPLSDPPDYG